MSIKTTKTEAHRQRMAPAKLKKAGLHAIEDNFYASCTPSASASTAATAATAAATPVRNSTMRGAPYTCPELSTPSTRPGAMDAFRLPSRTSFAADTTSKD